MATGGGHGYTTTYQNLQNGISIQMSAFTSVDVNPGNNTMTVGGATRFRDTFDPLYNVGKEIRKLLHLNWFFFMIDISTEVGSGTCVGFVGATLGAGVGRYQGLHGLVIDALLSVRLITASGDLITVSNTEHSDLFWAIRGAGANFGVITYATYRIADLTNQGQVLNADMRFPMSKNESYWKLLQSFQSSLPAPASLFTLVNYDTTYGGVCNP